MCCLFGLLDIKHSLSVKEKKRILSVLGTFCEARGVDATGYCYVSNRNLVIKKKAVPAHEMTFKIHPDAYVIMGHTRMTSQGSAARQRNNHPFLGRLPQMQFALAHNGVLSNDKDLRKTENLPHTNIETDSYVAVQLIEKERTLDFNSLKVMAEKVKGTFTFTVMDIKNNLYIIKGNNPMCLYYFPDRGIYLYASTRAILDAALDVLGYLDRYHEEIPIAEGEILKIDAKGNITREHFQPPASIPAYYDCGDDYDAFWNGWEDIQEAPAGYRKYLMDFAESFGVPRQELDYLHRIGISDFEMEECVYNKNYRRMLLLDTGYYSEMEEWIDGSNHSAENLPWAQT